MAPSKEDGLPPGVSADAIHLVGPGTTLFRTSLSRMILRKTADRALQVGPRLFVMAALKGFSQIEVITGQKTGQNLCPARAINLIWNDSEFFPDSAIILIESRPVSAEYRHVHVQKQGAIQRQFGSHIIRHSMAGSCDDQGVRICQNGWLSKLFEAFQHLFCTVRLVRGRQRDIDEIMPQDRCFDRLRMPPVIL